MDWIYLTFLIPLVILLVLFLLIGIYRAYRLMMHGDPGQPRLAVVSTTFFIVACDLAFLFLIVMAVILILRIVNGVSDVSAFQNQRWFEVISILTLAPAFVLGMIALAIRVWLDVVLPWRSARQRGEGFWLGRHSDG